MRLPNGYGCVFKLSGKRRKPYAARVTIGYDLDLDNRKVRQKVKYIGYYETKKEAIKALADYNPDIMPEKTTLEQLFNRWAEIDYSRKGQSYKLIYNAAFKVLTSLHSSPVKDITLEQYQHIIDTSDKNYPTLKNVVTLLRKLYDFGVMTEIFSQSKRKMIDFINISNRKTSKKIQRKIFSKDEINKLWENPKDESRQIILILIYTGLRIGEFLNLKPDDVYLKDRYFDVKKSKTNSGIRKVPIAEKIVPFFEHWLNKNSEFVFEASHLRRNDNSVNYHLWDNITENLEMTHKPHDTRHTCVSLLADAGVDMSLIKKIVGHSAGNVTEDVYLHVSLEAKIKAINLI